MTTVFGEDKEEEEDVIDVEAKEVDASDDIVPADGAEGIVTPAADLDKIKEGIQAFDKVKKEILSSSDVQKISGDNHITKSGWRKIATAFNVSVEVVESQRIFESGVIKYKVTAKAVAPNGKTVTGMGMCASNESNHMETLDDVVEPDKERDDIIKVDGKWRRLKKPNEVNEHNIMATAETRAKNRAISDLVGGGEVSAEEMKSFILE